ncbi:MAG: prepilin-type N-terminal cleavage/methylation domain-containing protein, partial [Ignavibacteriota bacterium]
MKRGEAGVTLIEVLVAVTLLSLLSLGMVMAMRVGLAAYSKTETKLMDNRRVAGAQRILQSQLEGLVPAFVMCGAGQAGPGTRAVLFQGSARGECGWSPHSPCRKGGAGGRKFCNCTSIPGDEGGVRLVVNERPYTGPLGAGQYCTGTVGVSGSISRLAQMIPTETGAQTFVLADKLAYCRFSYYVPSDAMYGPPAWQPAWASKGWPLAVRIEMGPSTADPSRLQPITVTAPIHVRRDPEKVYTDEN